MNLEKLAEALGLPKDSPQDKVFARLLEERREWTAAKESLSKLTGELLNFGLKLDQGKLVKTEGATVEAEALAIKPTDDPEAAAIKRELLERRQKDQLSAVASTKALAESFIKDGRIPPAVREALTRLLGAPEKSQVLALSSDGKEIVSHLANVRQDAITVLSALPKVTLQSTGLSQLKTEPIVADPNAAKDPLALEKRGKEIAARTSKSSVTYKEKKAAAGK